MSLFSNGKEVSGQATGFSYKSKARLVLLTDAQDNVIRNVGKIDFVEGERPTFYKIDINKSTMKVEFDVPAYYAVLSGRMMTRIIGGKVLIFSNTLEGLKERVRR